MELEQRPPLDILERFVFDNTEYHVEIIWENGKPLFKAADIGSVLGLTNVRMSIAHFDTDEKGVRLAYTLGGMQETIMLTQVGVYRLVMSSKKPIARPFQKWVARVIEGIQLTGRYELKNLQEEVDHIKTLLEHEQKKSELKNMALIKAYHFKEVVYFGQIGEIDGKKLIKLGQTKDIWTTFMDRHPGDYGQIELLHAVECQLNEQFEYFLLQHEEIKKYRYKEPVKLDGSKSHEIILVDQNELERIYAIVKANLPKYQAIKDVQLDIRNVMAIMSQVVSGFEETRKEIAAGFDRSRKEVEEAKEELRREFNNEGELAKPVKKEPQKRKRIREREKGSGKCLGCETKISTQAKFCIACAKGNQEKKFEVSKEELYDLVHVQKIPYTKLGLKFGVSDNAVRKRCKTLGIEVKRIKRV
jgi:prophage antirepressor-like protein